MLRNAATPPATPTLFPTCTSRALSSRSKFTLQRVCVCALLPLPYSGEGGVRVCAGAFKPLTDQYPSFAKAPSQFASSRFNSAPNHPPKPPLEIFQRPIGLHRRPAPQSLAVSRTNPLDTTITKRRPQSSAFTSEAEPDGDAPDRSANGAESRPLEQATDGYRHTIRAPHHASFALHANRMEGDCCRRRSLRLQRCTVSGHGGSRFDMGYLLRDASGTRGHDRRHRLNCLDD